MNDVFTYKFTRNVDMLKDSYYTVMTGLYGSASIGLGYGTIISIIDSSETGDLLTPIVIGGVFAGHAAITGLFASLGIKKRKKNRSYNNKVKVVKESGEKLPLECIDSVVFSNEKDVSDLLGWTERKDAQEWGAMLEMGTKGKKTGVVMGILPPEETVENGYITEISSHSLRWDTEKGLNDGYAGFHHYHPKGISSDYHVSLQDRISGFPGMFHLITFNTRKGPEVIGHNTRFTYLPSDSTKKELVKADNKMILEYITKTSR